MAPGLANACLTHVAAGRGGYAQWRAHKLAAPPPTPAALLVEVRDPRRLSQHERAAILERCRRYNMALYAFAGEHGAAALAALAGQLGLRQVDPSLGADALGIAEISARGAGGAGAGATDAYIPYSPQPLNWHTDGYYNAPARRIRAFLLHCVRPASHGGANVLLDPEIALVWLHDREPAWIDALAHPEAMTIPARNDGPRVVRPACTGPVFSLDADTGHVHLRYTARTRSIEWRDHAPTRAAAAALRALLEAGSAHHVRVRLEAGQGVVCNNVLHCREGFADGNEPGRTLLRARYLERVAES